MNTRAAIPPTEQHRNVTAGIVRRFAQIAIGFVIEAAILFLAAGRLAWAWAWVFLGISLVSVLINGTLLLRTSPETVAERGEYKEMQDWDKMVSGLWSLAQFLVLPLVAGLDARFGWPPQLSAAWHSAGAVVLAVGLGLSGWAMITNAYFSTVVPECPADAIFSEGDMPVEYSADIAANRRFFTDDPGYWSYDLEQERVRAQPV